MFSLTALALLSVLFWLGSWVAANRQLAATLDDRLNELKQKAMAIQEMQEDADERERRIAILNTIENQRVSALVVARELSKEIPSTAWLRSLVLKGDELRLEGFAQSASELVAILDQQAIFSDVGFLSPITIDKSGKERFSIGMKVVKPSAVTR